MQNKFTYRFANENDAEKIMFFIKALAVYEKMEHLVVATEADIKKWVFEEKLAEVIFAVSDGIEVGFAFYFLNFSTFQGRAGIHLEDLFVLPEHRGKGYGKALLKTLAKICAERGYGRLEWTCLDWNTPSIEFYEAFGAKKLSEWLIFRLEGDALINAAGIDK